MKFMRLFIAVTLFGVLLWTAPVDRKIFAFLLRYLNTALTMQVIVGRINEAVR